MFSILFGLGGFAFSFWFILTQGADKFTGFIDRSSLVLLVVAPVSVIFMSYSFLDFFAGLRTVGGMAFRNHAKEMNNISNQLTQLSGAVRTEGVGVLAQHRDRINNPLFRDGVSLILNSFSPDEIKHNLSAKIVSRQTQFQHAANLFESLGKLCPGMGLLGTIIGLVEMLSNLSDPTKLGPGMAVALLTTLYGLILGTVIYTPISEKITIYAEKALQLDTMIMEGVVLLKEKKSNAHFRDVLNTYSQGGARGGGGAGDANGGQPMSAAPRSRMPGPGQRGA